MVLKGFPNVVRWGQQYDFGEKRTVILHTLLYVMTIHTYIHTVHWIEAPCRDTKTI